MFVLSKGAVMPEKSGIFSCLRVPGDGFGLVLIHFAVGAGGGTIWLGVAEGWARVRQDKAMALRRHNSLSAHRFWGLRHHAYGGGAICAQWRNSAGFGTRGTMECFEPDCAASTPAEPGRSVMAQDDDFIRASVASATRARAREALPRRVLAAANLARGGAGGKAGRGSFREPDRARQRGWPGARQPGKYGAGHSRRVIVKASIVRLSGKGAAAAAAHLRYLQRDGTTRDGERGTLYGRDEDAVDAKAFQDAGGRSPSVPLHCLAGGW
jgi:hypothetical protein